jgi:hypothetical protein
MWEVTGRNGGVRALFPAKWEAENWKGDRKDYKIKKVFVKL